MLTDSDFQTFVRKPFVVKATEITSENIEDIASMIGEVRTRNNEQYIALDRRVVPNVGRAFIGWWVTVLNGNIRCYAPKVFKEQFSVVPEDNMYTIEVNDEDIDLPFIFDEVE